MPLSELTDPQAVLNAIDEFEELGAEKFFARHGYGDARRYLLKVGERTFPSKAIAGVAYNKQHPDRPTLKEEGGFSGGEGTVVRRLRDLGFEVIDSLAGSREASDSLQEVLSALNQRQAGEVEDQAVRDQLKVAKEACRKLASENVQVRGSSGVGKLADVPWIAFFAEDERASAQSEYYLVYLFAHDGSSVYLGLGHSAEDAERSEKLLQKRTHDLRQAGGRYPELEIRPDLRSQNSLPRAYEVATAYAIEYQTGELPDDATLRRDIERFEEIRLKISQSGLSFAEDALHLVLKWRSTTETQTVSRHREVTGDRGAVWWGGFGNRPLAQRRIARLRDQIAREVPSYAFLYGGGEVWRAEILDVTNDPEEVDVSLLPDYYGTSECAYFVKLTNFHQLDRDYLAEHVVLAKDPDPKKLPGALGNQSTPLYVRLHTESGASEIDTRRTNVAREVLTLDWLAQETLWTRESLTELIDSLQTASQQVVLAGPPGTGKTWVARALARFLTNDEPLGYRIVQFHPSYGYEDFIEGLRPTARAGAIEFERKDGTVLALTEAIQDDAATHVLIIDEMNRANLPRVFGELMYLFEYRDQPIDLRFTTNFRLPANLLFIGTMNTADRSIRSIDIALRRRFEVFECLPDAHILERYYLTHDNQVSDLTSGFTTLNADLEEQLDRHHTIGHSFFMHEHMTAQKLRHIWKRRIGPLIEEYFFDQPDIAREFAVEKYWNI